MMDEPSKMNDKECFEVNYVKMCMSVVLFLLACLCPVAAHELPVLENRSFSRHPISVVEANIYISRFQLTMKLKCFAEDLELLQGVEPLDDGFYDPDELYDATRDHAEYLAEKITLRDINGELLTPKLVEIVDMQAPDTGVPAGTLMQHQLEFVYEIEFTEPPEFITIQQDMVAEGALLPSEAKVLLRQAGSDAGQMRMLKPRQPETFQLDWDMPALSAGDSAEELAQMDSWFEEQRQKNYGISSYSSTYSFIYITDHEVRHEVLIPLATLSTLMDLEREDESFLEVAEQPAAAKKIEAFFSDGNPVEIDGIVVQPVFDRIDFYGLDLRDFAIQAEKRRVSMANGRVGVIMAYSTKGRPTSVSVTWDKYNEVIRAVEASVIAYDKVQKMKFSKFLNDNTFHWTAPDRKPLPPITGIASTIDFEQLKPVTWKRKIPISLILLGLIGLTLIFVGKKRVMLCVISVSIMILGVGSYLSQNSWQVDVVNLFAKPVVFEIEDGNAKLVFAQLHKNMFRAFDYYHESDVYDALAKSIDGDLLRKLYLQINRSMKVKEQGGAIARIQEVNLLEGEKSDAGLLPAEPGFGFRCKWNLIGTIEHWGHIHQRTNQYEALFTVRLIDDSWKITAMEMLDESQGVVKTDQRKFEGQ